MPTYRLHPGAVTFTKASGSPSGGGVTGAEPQWADTSDATFAKVMTVRDGGGIHSDTAQAVLTDALPADLDTSKVVAITAGVRVSTTNSPSNTNRQIRVLLPGTAATFGGKFGVSDWVLPNTNATRDLTGSVDEATLSFSGQSLASVAEWLKTPFRTVRVARSDGGVSGVTMAATFYELWIDVTWSDGGCERQAVPLTGANSQFIDDDGTADTSLAFLPGNTYPFSYDAALRDDTAGFELATTLRAWRDLDELAATESVLQWSLTTGAVDLAGDITVSIAGVPGGASTAKVAQTHRLSLADVTAGAPASEGALADALFAAVEAGTLTGVLTAPGTNPGQLDVYQFQLVLFTVGCLTSRRLKRRPLRQFPRDDGLGMSSARRVDANRSMQASLRRGGGVYF